MECHGYIRRARPRAALGEGHRGPQRGQRGELQESRFGDHLVAGQRERRRRELRRRAQGRQGHRPRAGPVHYEAFRHRRRTIPPTSTAACTPPSTEVETAGQGPEPHQAFLHVRIRPRHEQLHGRHRRVQRPVRQVPQPDGRRHLGVGGPGPVEPARSQAPIPRLRRRLRRGAQRPLLHSQGRGLLRPHAQAALPRGEARLPVDRLRGRRTWPRARSRIRNKYAFTNLERFERRVDHQRGWRDPWIAARSARLDLRPGAEALVNMPYERIVPKPGAEYFLQRHVRIGQGRDVGQGRIRDRRGAIQAARSAAPASPAACPHEAAEALRGRRARHRRGRWFHA